jgi:sigma54-dependent transcription regulator
MPIHNSWGWRGEPAEKEFERLGSGKPVRVNVRILAATHRDVEALLKAGQFREGLYYRLRYHDQFAAPKGAARGPAIVDGALSPALCRKK